MELRKAYMDIRRAQTWRERGREGEGGRGGGRDEAWLMTALITLGHTEWIKLELVTSSERSWNVENSSVYTYDGAKAHYTYIGS